VCRLTGEAADSPIGPREARGPIAKEAVAATWGCPAAPSPPAPSHDGEDRRTAHSPVNKKPVISRACPDLPAPPSSIEQPPLGHIQASRGAPDRIAHLHA